jgi:hypothetical protein
MNHASLMKTKNTGEQATFVVCHLFSRAGHRRRWEIGKIKELSLTHRVKQWMRKSSK